MEEITRIARRAQWVESDGCKFCSDCQLKIPLNLPEVLMSNLNFCPKCGCYMVPAPGVGFLERDAEDYGEWRN